MKISGWEADKALEDLGGDCPLIKGGIKSRKQTLFLVMVDDRLGETQKFGMAISKVLLVVICPRTGRTIACGAVSAIEKLVFLASPTTLWTLNSIVDTIEKLSEWDFQGDDGIDFEIPRSDPIIEKTRLRNTAGEAIQHPPPGLVGEPLREDGTHQIVWEILSAIQNGLGFISKCGGLLHMFAE